MLLIVYEHRWSVGRTPIAYRAKRLRGGLVGWEAVARGELHSDGDPRFPCESLYASLPEPWFYAANVPDGREVERCEAVARERGWRWGGERSHAPREGVALWLWAAKRSPYEHAGVYCGVCWGAGGELVVRARVERRLVELARTRDVEEALASVPSRYFEAASAALLEPAPRIASSMMEAAFAADALPG